MKNFYFRWSGILIFGLVMTLIAWQRYFNEVAVITPGQLKKEALSTPVRIQGRIAPGSLKLDLARHQAEFQLTAGEEEIPVYYSGDDLDTLREFKTVVLIGILDPRTGHFESKKMALTPNYGFILSAYLVGLIPLAFFLFYMERKVILLYDIIKQEKIYQPEETL